MNKKHRPARKLPATRGPSGARYGITIKEYIVGDWCPTPDGSGPAKAVAIQLMTNLDGDASFFWRLRSPASVDELMAALERHRDSVWPEWKGRRNEHG